jgi:hypothetical protein
MEDDFKSIQDSIFKEIEKINNKKYSGNKLTIHLPNKTKEKRKEVIIRLFDEEQYKTKLDDCIELYNLFKKVTK